MAQLDPTARLRAVVSSSPRFELKIHEIAPEDIIPNGDRYVVEVIDLDETVQLGQLLVVTQPSRQNPNDPLVDPTVENRGVLAAVVVSVGNGHLLGLPDPALAVLNRNGCESVERSKADVPMFYEPGDVVLVDHNAKGRALKIVGRECRIVNQIDVLAALPKVKLLRTERGWEKVG